MNDELNKALAWADEASEYTNPRITEIGEDGYLATLAAAVRELREENARLRAHLSGSPLDHALNEGDGTYKP